MVTKTQNKTILALTDSLSLPRNKPELVKYYETWPVLLKKNVTHELTLLAIGGSTIKGLFEQSRYYKPLTPDIIIIQAGIVDCAPRALSLLEKEIINSNRYLSALSARLLPVSSMRKIRNITYTSKKQFSYYIDQIIRLFNGAQIIWVSILPASLDYENKLSGITKNIEQYNAIIKNYSEHSLDFYYLDTSMIPQNGITSDFHHLNYVGHSWLVQRILGLLKTIDSASM